jgi:hypothetical protein
MSEFEKLIEQTYAKLGEDKSVSKDDDNEDKEDKKKGITVKASSSWRDAHENEEDVKESATLEEGKKKKKKEPKARVNKQGLMGSKTRVHKDKKKEALKKKSRKKVDLDEEEK